MIWTENNTLKVGGVEVARVWKGDPDEDGYRASIYGHELDEDFELSYPAKSAVEEIVGLLQRKPKKLVWLERPFGPECTTLFGRYGKNLDGTFYFDPYIMARSYGNVEPVESLKDCDAAQSHNNSLVEGLLE